MVWAITEAPLEDFLDLALVDLSVRTVAFLDQATLQVGPWVLVVPGVGQAVSEELPVLGVHPILVVSVVT